MNEQAGRSAAVQTLFDKQEVYELLMRYCRAIDRCDKPLLRSVYHADATDDHGVFKGKALDFCEWVMATLRTMKLTTHSISNVLIEVDGDVAYGEAYFVAYHRIEREGKDYDHVVGGRYIAGHAPGSVAPVDQMLAWCWVCLAATTALSIALMVLRRRPASRA